ncbi:hypothetical protein K6U52_06830 [Vibrio vulnificus]|nr:hypothetical protein [Vibrio vulnificus]
MVLVVKVVCGKFV